jgi:hypothetical protein
MTDQMLHFLKLNSAKRTKQFWQKLHLQRYKRGLQAKCEQFANTLSLKSDDFSSNKEFFLLKNSSKCTPTGGTAV